MAVQTRSAPAYQSQVLRDSQSSGVHAEAARERLVPVFGERVRSLSGRISRRYYVLPQDQHDVVSETYQQILNPEFARFDTARGEPLHYIEGLVKNAARKVITERGGRRATSVITEREPCGRTENPAAAAARKDTVTFVLSHASPVIRRALELYYWDCWTLQAIAEHLGVSRFVLARKLYAFLGDMRAKLGDN